MWFCSSGFGPGPSSGDRRRRRPNGLAGPKLSTKKNARHDEHHDQRPADERVARARLRNCAADRGGVAGEDQRPTAGSSPRAPTTSRRSCTAPACRRADLLDVRQREVAGDQRPLHHRRTPATAPPTRPARRSAAPCAARARCRVRDAVDRRQRTERDAARAPSSSPAWPSAPFRLAREHRASDSASQRRPGVGPAAIVVDGDVLVGVLDLDPVALERAVADDLAVDDHRDALLEDPARLAVVADRHRDAVERDRERR